MDVILIPRSLPRVCLLSLSLGPSRLPLSSLRLPSFDGNTKFSFPQFALPRYTYKSRPRQLCQLSIVISRTVLANFINTCYYFKVYSVGLEISAEPLCSTGDIDRVSQHGSAVDELCVHATAIGHCGNVQYSQN